MSFPVEIIVPVQHDAFMADYVPDTELGDLSYVRVGWDTGKINATTRGLLRHSLADLPSDFRTMEAELWGHCITAAALPAEVQVYSLLLLSGLSPPSEAWVESEVTWNDYKASTAWSTPGGGGDYSLLLGTFSLPTVTGDFMMLDGDSLVEIVENGRTLVPPRTNLLARRTVENFSSAEIRMNSKEAGGSPAGPWLVLKGYRKTVHLVGGVQLVGGATLAGP